MMRIDTGIAFIDSAGGNKIEIITNTRFGWKSSKFHIIDIMWMFDDEVGLVYQRMVFAEETI
jgi:hypothetical protein